MKSKKIDMGLVFGILALLFIATHLVVAFKRGTLP